MDTIVGMMWNLNEADVLEETITAFLPHVDSLFIADDGSNDGSWDIIKSLKASTSKIEHIQQKPSPKVDKGQRNSLLNEIRRRYKPENTWVQTMESDMTIAPFIDLRDNLSRSTVLDMAMYWRTWNAIRDVGSWYEVDTYPNWNEPVLKLMNKAHRLEDMMYTFRPLPDLFYGNRWRPWPNGFARYMTGVIREDRWKPQPPVIVHYGHRGPTHFWEKYKHLGNFHPRYKNWDLRSVGSVELTVSYFNGDWNGKGFEISREGFRTRHKNSSKRRLPKLTETKYANP